MKRYGRLFTSVWAVLGALALLSPAVRAQGSPALDSQEARYLQKFVRPAGSATDVRGSRDVARPQYYESEDKTGGLHTIGNVWMHMDNNNYSPGNIWWLVSNTTSQDPGMQWPGSSGIEYIIYSTLWVAGKDKDGIRRVSDFDEIRGELPEFAHTRHAYEGIPNGGRGRDDDTDGKIDEDYLNGKDDDGDGLIDEDYGAVSPDMFATEMLDYTPEAINDPGYTEPHVPLGIRVQRSSYAWSTPGGNDFVGVHWEITNMTRITEGVGRDIDSIFVGVFWREAVGARTNPSFNSDDLVGMFEIAADGKTHPADIVSDINHPDRASHEDSILHIFWQADNDGDEGRTPGAGALLFLGATRFPRLGFKDNVTSEDAANDDYGNAPRHMSVHSYRFFRSSLPYSQGGRPTTDLEEFDAMSNANKKDLEFPDLDNTGVYRQLFSVGPYVALPADSTIEFDVAYVVGKADYTGKTRLLYPTTLDKFDIFDQKFGTQVTGSLLTSCLEAWTAWQGLFKPNDNYVAHNPLQAGDHGCGAPRDIRNPGDRGRETCIKGPVGKQVQYRDCQDLEGEFRELSDQHCTWFDMDCDVTTGVCDGSGTPLVDHVRWVGSAPPVPPRVSIVRGDQQVQVLWDDISEKIPNPGKLPGDILDFQGYRLYRAVGWKRDAATGPNGPATDLWELVGDWARPDMSVSFSVLDSVRNHDPAVISPIDSLNWDTGVSCPPHRGAPCHVHKVGYYKYVDKNVLNGFRYFYAVTAYNETLKPTPWTTPLDTSEHQETGRSATEASVVVPVTDCSPDVNHIKTVPNPYRFKAAWDLLGNSGDPTGTHINFNHLPCGRFTLRVFTLAGDLVRTFDQTDARGGGTVEWNLVSRNGQDIKAGIYVYSVESDRGHTVGRFTVIR